MKICKYCNTEVNDNSTECKSCGSNELNNKCNNCGMVFDAAFCPNCGIRAGEKPKICPSCGTKSFGAYCSKCGTDLLNKHREDSRPHEESSTPPQVVKHRNRQITKRKYNNIPESNEGCLVIFSLIAAVIITIVILVAILKPSAPLQTAGFEMITKKDHPKYMDSYKAAKVFWKGYDNIKVNTSWSSYYDKNLLLFVNKRDSDKNIIQYMYFNFSGAEDKNELISDDILRVVCNYIPYDKIDKYYNYANALVETSKNGPQDYISFYYVMELNDEGRKANMNLEPKLTFRIYCKDKNNWFAEIGYNDESDKFEPDYYRNDVKEWKIDLNKYRPE